MTLKMICVRIDGGTAVDDDLRGLFPSGFEMPGGLSTRMAIAHAVDKPIDEMSVTQICKRAGISRQAFYKYFSSKYGVSIWFAQMCQDLYLNQVGRRYTCIDGYSRHFRLLSTERELFFNTASGGDVPSKKWGNIRGRTGALLETLVSYCGLERTPELEFKVEFFIYGEIEMGRRWMANRMVEQPEVLARRMVASMPEGMCAALDASALMRRGKI